MQSEKLISIHETVRRSLCELLKKTQETMPKIFLTDQETLNYISVAMTNHEMYEREIITLGTIDTYFATQVDGVNAPDFAALQCLCLLPPTQLNIHLICDDLRKPHFHSYYLSFTSPLEPNLLKELASNDIYHLVQDVTEFFLNYSPLQDQFFSFNMPNIQELRHNTSSPQIDQIVQKLIGVFQTNNRKAVVRYQEGSPLAEAVARRFQDQYDQLANVYFNQSSQDSTTLLIMDRLSDPLFPVFKMLNIISLLAEYYPFKNNIFEVSPDLQPTDKPIYVVINQSEDECFDRFFLLYPEMVNNNSDLDLLQDTPDKEAEQIKLKMQSEYSKSRENACTYLCERYIAKQRVVKRENLIELQQAEKLIEKLGDYGLLTETSNDFYPDKPFSDRIDVLRSALIIAVSHNDPALAKSFLQSNSPEDKPFTDQEIQCIDTIIDLCKGKNVLKQSTVETIAKALSESKGINGFPFVHVPSPTASHIIFVIGGTTYSECSLIQSFDDVALGGTFIHNFKSYLDNEIFPLNQS